MMRGPPRQFTLDWPQEPSFAREDFLVAPSNREALAAIEQWPAWGGRSLLLVGPEGSGKSHLATIWSRRASAAIMRADAINDASVAASARAKAIVIDDADRIGENELGLFHVVNASIQAESWMLLTSRTAPDSWSLRIPDLLSRLRLAPVVHLGAPDLDLTEAVLFKLFSDRQLQVDPRVVGYIAVRMERSLGAARSLVALLDKEALARRVKVTRAVASELMQRLDAGKETP
jgi:chromosomal replication initiation ATPase DnaA